MILTVKKLNDIGYIVEGVYTTDLTVHCPELWRYDEASDIWFQVSGYVDQTLPNYRSSQARSVHHLVPPDIDRSLANKRENCRLAHIGCNSRAGRGAYGDPRRGPRGRVKGQGLRARGYGRVRVAAGVPRVAVTSDRDW